MSVTPRRVVRPKSLGYLMFASRWLQVPLYLGLIVAQAVYVWQFALELWHLVETVFLHGEVTVANAPSPEVVVMLTVLALIDVVMISNLLIMVIIGGYETFVSRIDLNDHPDEPEWLSHVNANVLKVKLATAIIGISSVHLLQTFIRAQSTPNDKMMWQTIMHLAFVASAVGLAYIDRLLAGSPAEHTKPHL
ncbi:TIGR00645 family protein [Nonomuraea fuscirosea]|uniref:TIGR00645 family protein n=1 Tax=Nonomuraea fuscirosea TaxID=1291556 RepID=UPI001FEAAD7E|nr:TIGR00645 family protein [Nonomuraea fuscirosea]WSA50683.1 TIGR00645 family protein [Nonomuraea fuscirosea]